MSEVQYNERSSVYFCFEKIIILPPESIGGIKKTIFKIMQIQRLGHSMFKITSPKGQVIVVDPWITGNPTCPATGEQNWKDINVVLITHGHFDHFLGLDDILKVSPETKIIASFELGLSLLFKGKKNVMLINKGGRLEIEGIKYYAVAADHSSSFSDLAQGKTEYLGEPLGYIVELEDGFKVYLAGDTGLTSDMKFIIHDFFKPDLAVLPVSGVFTLDPEQALFAVKAIEPKYVIPCHDFPKPEQAADAAGMNGFISQFPFVQWMTDRSQEFAKKMEKVKKTKCFALGYGETKEIV